MFYKERQVAHCAKTVSCTTKHMHNKKLQNKESLQESGAENLSSLSMTKEDVMF